LIIGLGGGADALAGLANGVGPMTAIELNPVTVRLGRDDFRDFNGNLFNSPRLDVVNGEARHWVESHDEKFDLIVLNSIDTLSALSSGAYVLAESYLYTVEAFRSYLSRLAPGGIYALYSTLLRKRPPMQPLSFTTVMIGRRIAKSEMNMVWLPTSWCQTRW